MAADKGSNAAWSIGHNSLRLLFRSVATLLLYFAFNCTSAEERSAFIGHHVAVIDIISPRDAALGGEDLLTSVSKYGLNELCVVNGDAFRKSGSVALLIWIATVVIYLHTYLPIDILL